MSVIEQHIAYWLRRYPKAESHRDDIAQEASLAHWLAAKDYRADRGATLGTFAWRRMYTSVRAYLGRAGVLRGWRTVTEVEHGGEGIETAAPDSADAPLVLAEAWGALLDGYARRGFTARHAEALARLDVGQTFAEAGAAIGVSRQAVHQVAMKLGMHERSAA